LQARAAGAGSFGSTGSASQSGVDKSRALAEFNALKYGPLPGEAVARRGLLQDFPEPATHAAALDSQQRALIHKQERELRDLQVRTEGARSTTITKK
jgi:hypothetical protein